MALTRRNRVFLLDFTPIGVRVGHFELQEFIGELNRRSLEEGTTER
jgi:hypothetical protein